MPDKSSQRHPHLHYRKTLISGNNAMHLRFTDTVPFTVKKRNPSSSGTRLRSTFFINPSFRNELHRITEISCTVQHGPIWTAHDSLSHYDVQMELTFPAIKRPASIIPSGGVIRGWIAVTGGCRRKADVRSRRSDYLHK